MKLCDMYVKVQTERQQKSPADVAGLLTVKFKVLLNNNLMCYNTLFRLDL
jgi:hypothetical protein